MYVYDKVDVIDLCYVTWVSLNRCVWYVWYCFAICIQSRKGEVGVAVKHAIDSGYRHIDCAFDYNNEEEVGAALAEKIEDGTVTRTDMFVTTKARTKWRY